MSREELSESEWRFLERMENESKVNPEVPVNKIKVDEILDEIGVSDTSRTNFINTLSNEGLIISPSKIKIGTGNSYISAGHYEISEVGRAALKKRERDEKREQEEKQYRIEQKRLDRRTALIAAAISGGISIFGAVVMNLILG